MDNLFMEEIAQLLLEPEESELESLHLVTLDSFENVEVKAVNDQGHSLTTGCLFTAPKTGEDIAEGRTLPDVEVRVLSRL